jgi:hypothetical protein
MPTFNMSRGRRCICEYSLSAFCCIAKQKYEAEGQQKPGVKQERAVAHCEVTEQRANENKPDTMGPSAMIGDKSPLHSLTCPAISQQRDGVLIESPARGAQSMVNMSGIVQQLKEEHDRLSRQLQGISAALSAFGAAYGKETGAGTTSAVRRARISAAQKARSAKVKGNGGKSAKIVATPKKRTMSASARRKIAAAQRARWAKVRAAKR